MFITIKRGGMTVAKRSLPGAPTNMLLVYPFECPLRSGSYRYYMRCVDAAGNRSLNTSSRGFRVF